MLRLVQTLTSFDGATMWLGQPIDIKTVTKPVLVHFFAMSCGYCKESLQQITLLSEQFGKKLEVISVHRPRVPKDMDQAEVKKIMESLGIRHPVCLDHQHLISDRLHVEFVPAYYLFDETKHLRHYQAGNAGIERLKKRIVEVMNI